MSGATRSIRRFHRHLAAGAAGGDPCRTHRPGAFTGRRSNGVTSRRGESGCRNLVGIREDLPEPVHGGGTRRDHHAAGWNAVPGAGVLGRRQPLVFPLLVGDARLAHMEK